MREERQMLAGFLVRRYPKTGHTENMEMVRAQISQAVQIWERGREQMQPYEKEDAMWLAEDVVYTPAPWSDGLSVTQIKSRRELATVLKASRPGVSRADALSFDVMILESGCQSGDYFLYHVGEPDTKGPLVKILSDGEVWEIIDQGDRDLAPLAAWLKDHDAFHRDFSPLERACNLLSQAGIAKMIYQTYWYGDEDQFDIQSCLDEQGHELATTHPNIYRAHWILHYEQNSRRYEFGQYELLVAERRLTRLGDAQTPHLDEDDPELSGEEYTDLP